MGVATCLATPSAFAQSSYTPQELEREAAVSLREGNPAKALALADALLARDKSDVTPHLLRARALRDMGRVDEARDAAKAAWKLSETKEEKFSSSLIMAQALSTAEKRTRAQLWLRRAVEHAPSPALAQRAKRDFKYVQQRNPWQTYLSFTLAPNSNINNGSARETSSLNYVISDLLYGGPIEYELTGASRALSGIEIGGNVLTRYRYSQTATTAHDIVANFAYRSYVLSNSAKSLAPEASGSDFAFGYVSLGYGYRQINSNGRGQFSFLGDVNQSFYAGSRYSSGLMLSVSQGYRLSNTKRIRFSALANTQNGQRSPDSDTLTLATYWDQRLASGDDLSLKFSLGGKRSSDADFEYDEVAIKTVYSLGKPIMGAALQFELGAAFRDYDVSRHDPDGREDVRLTADVTAVFRDIDYYGFNPSVTFSASSTVSNINLYDSNRFGLSVGIRSAF